MHLFPYCIPSLSCYSPQNLNFLVSYTACKNWSLTSNGLKRILCIITLILCFIEIKNKGARRMIHIAANALQQFLATYGYFAVFVFVAIESIGIPFPGETMLLVAAIDAGKTHQLSIVLIILAATLGAIVGDNIGFWIGREGGYRVLRRYGKYIGFDERKLKVGIYMFRKHGGKVVFFGRFVAVLRAWAAFLAGVNRMTWSRFLVFNALGGFVWATLYGLGGYLLGEQIHRLTGPVGIISIILAIIFLVAFTIFVWRNEKQLEIRAEKALPGPIENY